MLAVSQGIVLSWHNWFNKLLAFLHTFIFTGRVEQEHSAVSGLDLRTLMMLLRRGAAFTDSRRTVSESWPPPGRMTPLRRPRDVLGGMQSGAPSPSPYPSRSDMSTRRRTRFGNTSRGRLMNSSDLTRIKFHLAVCWCHLKENGFLLSSGISRSAVLSHWRKLISPISLIMNRLSSSPSWLQAVSVSWSLQSTSAPLKGSRWKSEHHTQAGCLQCGLGWGLDWCAPRMRATSLHRSRRRSSSRRGRLSLSVKTPPSLGAWRELMTARWCQ